MLDKKLSVIIPVYNVEKFLSATINSVVSQTYKNTEIILVNDGSTDKSLEICRKFEKTDSRIKVVDKQNEGVSSARNAGINASTGEYIAFVDSDDIVLPNIYESMILKIEKTNAQIAICNIYDVLILKNGSEEVGLIDHNMSDNTVFEKEQIYNKMILPWMGIGEKTQITNCINSVFNKVYKTELIKGNNILYREDLRVGEDSEFVIRTLLNAESLVFDSNIGYKYMRHNQDSLTHKCMKDLFYIKCKRYEIFKELVPEYCSSEEETAYKFFRFERECLEHFAKLPYKEYCSLIKPIWDNTILKMSYKKFYKNIDNDFQSKILKIRNKNDFNTYCKFTYKNQRAYRIKLVFSKIKQLMVNRFQKGE